MMKADRQDQARRIHSSLPVVDGHNDLPWAIRTRAAGSLDVANPATRLVGYHTDIDRLLAGGVGAQFWSVYVPAWSEQPFVETLQQADLVKRMVAENPDQLASAYTAADVRRVRDEGRIACLLGAEGGHSIEDSLENLRALYEVGVRYMTLTHSKTLSWADSATDEARHGGLTAFGRDVVREMNRLGMMVDISHVSVATMRDALNTSTAPLIASHSSCYALAPHPRNIPDHVLERVADNGGVVMVNFYPPFVMPELAARSIDLLEEAHRLMAELGDEAAVEDAIAGRWDDIEDTGDVARVVDHIEHVAQVAGIDHVGVGSDFDGVDVLPAGLEDVSCYPNITVELLQRGWDEYDIRKVLGDNMLRVMEGVEALSR
jgi:membrane dipeptidase